MARATLTLALLLAVVASPSGAGAQPAEPEVGTAGEARVQARRAERAGRLVSRARALASGGNRASALGTFRQAVQIDPRAVDAYIGLADLYAQARRMGDAFEAVRVGLARQPRSTKLQLRLAALHQHIGEHREALALLRAVVEHDADHLLALRAYVDAAQEVGAWSEALRGARRLKTLADRGLAPGAEEIDLRVRALSLLARPLDGACRGESAFVRALCARRR